MAQEDHLRQLRGTTPAITAIMAAYAGHRDAPGAGVRVLEALEALERDALAAEKRLMELIFAALDQARARVADTTTGDLVHRGRKLDTLDSG